MTVRHWLHGPIEAEVQGILPSGKVDLRGTGSWDWTCMQVWPNEIIAK